MAPTASTLSPQAARQLWQVPVFLLGLALLLLAAFLTRARPAAPLWKVLADARAALLPEGDAARAFAELQEVDRTGRVPPALMGEVHFLLGSLSVKLAEQEPSAGAPACGETNHARFRWLEARRHLDEALLRGVGPEDTGPLHFRLAKAAFYCGDSPEQVAPLLADSLRHADSSREAYSLLTQVYLRQQKPDLAAALAANEMLLHLPDLSEADRARACLQAGELLFRLHRDEEAHSILENIAPGAPADVLVRSRQLRAAGTASLPVVVAKPADELSLLVPVPDDKAGTLPPESGPRLPLARARSGGLAPMSKSLGLPTGRDRPGELPVTRLAAT